MWHFKSKGQIYLFYIIKCFTEVKSLYWHQSWPDHPPSPKTREPAHVFLHIILWHWGVLWHSWWIIYYFAPIFFFLQFLHQKNLIEKLWNSTIKYLSLFTHTWCSHYKRWNISPKCELVVCEFLIIICTVIEPIHIRLMENDHSSDL